MLGRNTIILVVILLLQTIGARADESDNTSCRLSTESASPEVTPWSPDAIKVSWDKVFIDCKKQDVMNLKVKVETQLNAVINYYSTDVEITANDAILSYSPCLKHKVYLVLSFTKSEKNL